MVADDCIRHRGRTHAYERIGDKAQSRQQVVLAVHELADGRPGVVRSWAGADTRAARVPDVRERAPRHERLLTANAVLVSVAADLP
jgi:hypothetical protein